MSKNKQPTGVVRLVVLPFPRLFVTPPWNCLFKYIDDLLRFVLNLLLMRICEFLAGKKHSLLALFFVYVLLPAENSCMRMRNKIKTNHDKSSISKDQTPH